MDLDRGDERNVRIGVDDVRDLYKTWAQHMRREWDRDLPPAEMSADRWERAAALGFGDGTSIYAESYVFGSPAVGSQVWIGPFTVLDATGGLFIGDGSTISAGVHIYTHDTVLRTLTGGQSEIVRSPVRIGKRVYIGPNCVVAKGVTVGNMCVVGASSFVNRDIAPYTIAVGTPAHPIGKVVVADDGHIEMMLDAPTQS
jgi:acetyltransferase-like isoleucine patch superfamily enzyme